MNFQKIPCNEDIKLLVKSAFSVELDISGCFGYSQDEALVINQTDTPIKQLEHTLASMRAILEMSMTLPKEQRYGAINVNEISRDSISVNTKTFDRVTYEITAMKESQYSAFIDEYKEGMEREDFDIQEHFKRRKKATIKREVMFWFDVTSLS